MIDGVLYWQRCTNFFRFKDLGDIAISDKSGHTLGSPEGRWRKPAEIALIILCEHPSNLIRLIPAKGREQIGGIRIRLTDYPRLRFTPGVWCLHGYDCQ